MLRLTYARMVNPDQVTDLLSRINSENQLLVKETDRQLLAILAAEALIVLFSRVNAGIGLVPALAVRCATHAGWDPVHPDLATYADAYPAPTFVVSDAAPLPAIASSKQTPKAILKPCREPKRSVRPCVRSSRASRDRIWERDQLAWWLLSETRSPTALAFARDFDTCLLFLPEPLASKQILASKLARKPAEPQPEPNFEVPPGIADLCADLLPGGQGGAPPGSEKEAALVRRFLDQILLSVLSRRRRNEPRSPNRRLSRSSRQNGRRGGPTAQPPPADSPGPGSSPRASRDVYLEADQEGEGGFARGEALGPLGAGRIAAQARATVIVLLGGANSGKTTCSPLSMSASAAAHFAGHWFLGSRTLARLRDALSPEPLRRRTWAWELDGRTAAGRTALAAPSHRSPGAPERACRAPARRLLRRASPRPIADGSR